VVALLTLLYLAVFLIVKKPRIKSLCKTKGAKKPSVHWP